MATFTYGLNTPWFEEVSREWIYKHFKLEEFVQCDTETTGLNCHTADLMCLQLGSGEDQFVIHPSLIGEFKTLLESKVLILHNAKFDLCFLYKYSIWPNKVYDTMLAEQVIYCGNPTVRHNLAAVAKRRIDVDIDKSVRDSIWKEGLTQRVIQYAGDDVLYLEKIKDAQQYDLDRLDLHDTLDLENDFVLALAYIEFCGFKLDPGKWKKKMIKDEKAYEEAKIKLNEFIINQGITKYISSQLDMFSTETKVNINWASSKQVVKLFKQLGINCTVTEKGKTKDSVEASVINKHADKFPIIKDYLDYKEKEKVVGTYGESFIQHINPVTKRIHTRFTQIKDTGRISSGGKDRLNKIDFPNLQNIPRDKETRAAFVAEKGNTLIGCDYSGQEQIVLANYSMDEELLGFYDKKLYGGDMHSFVTTRIWQDLDGLSLAEIKEHHSEKRTKAKNAGFAINYGGVGRTIADNLNISVEEGDRIYAAYMEAFPGLSKYWEEVKQASLKRGYILIDKVVRRKSFIYGYDEYKRLRKDMDRDFWDKWKQLKELKKEYKEKEKELPPSYASMYSRYRDKISRFFKIKGEIERKALNFPIQGTSANITKKSAIYFFEWIRKNQYQNKVLFCSQIHDENVAECPPSIADITAKALKDAMLRAGQIYCKRVPLNAEPELSPFWKK